MARCLLVPVGSAILPKTPLGSLACLLPLPLLSVTRAVWHTLMEDHVGEKVELLAQLRLPLARSSKYIPPNKRILFPAPHSLPCAPSGGTGVPCCQYTFSAISWAFPWERSVIVPSSSEAWSGFAEFSNRCWSK